MGGEVQARKRLQRGHRRIEFFLSAHWPVVGFSLEPRLPSRLRFNSSAPASGMDTKG